MYVGGIKKRMKIFNWQDRLKQKYMERKEAKCVIKGKW